MKPTAANRGLPCGCCGSCRSHCSSARWRPRQPAGPDAPVAAGASTTANAPAPAWGPVAIAAIDLIVVTVLVAFGLDVRLVLLIGALPLFMATGTVRQDAGQMVAEMANPATVVPIGAAVGFAFVLRTTGCDRHLVELLLVPIRRVRPLLVPGGIAAGYLINTTIVSQAGTASVLGPILLPLLRAGGLAPAQAGAVLLLGSSMGGELFNPGAVEMRKLAELTHLDGNSSSVGRPRSTSPLARRRWPRSGCWRACAAVRRQRRRSRIGRRKGRPSPRFASTCSRRSCRSCRWRS